MKRVLQIVLFVGLLLGVLASGHWYLARRLVLDAELSAPWQNLALAIVIGGALLLFLQPLGERLLRPPLSRAIGWPASLWMGFGFLLLVALGASELVWWLLGSSAEAASDGSAALDPSGARARALAVVALAGLAGGVGLRTALRPPAVKRVEISLARWPRALDGFRLVQISDLHVGPILGRRFAREVTERVNALAPDLIAVTGDLVDGSVSRLADEVAPFAALRAPCGVFFVTGNHDYYSGADRWVERVQELGMQVLRNRRVRIEHNGAAFELAGVEDHHAHLVTGEAGEDLPAALAGRDPELAVVLLAHDPASFRQAARLGVDLQLSGHTHGGQIWPFVYLVRLAVRFVAGHYALRDSRLYVSRGTGFWGPPMRLAAPAEISEIVLRPAD